MGGSFVFVGQTRVPSQEIKIVRLDVEFHSGVYMSEIPAPKASSHHSQNLTDVLAFVGAQTQKTLEDLGRTRAYVKTCVTISTYPFVAISALCQRL